MAELQHEVVEELPDLIRVQLLAERGEAGEVREEHGMRTGRLRERTRHLLARRRHHSQRLDLGAERRNGHIDYGIPVCRTQPLLRADGRLQATELFFVVGFWR